MAVNRNNILKKRIAGSSISSVISISLVLLLLGAAALFVMNASSIESYFKENIHLTAFLRKGTSDKSALALQSRLDKEPFIKETRYVSVEEGTAELVEMLGEDFVSVFATSPVPSSIEVKVYSDYLQQDSLSRVIALIEKNPEVESVSSQSSMIDSIGGAMGKVAAVTGVMLLLLLFISVVLISNTIRLIIYSNRFSIHTMQLVGASNSFIARPFIGKAAGLGLVSALISCAVIAGALIYVHSIFPQVFEILQPVSLCELAGGLVVTGVLICIVCAKLVMGRMVRLDNDKLYV